MRSQKQVKLDAADTRYSIGDERKMVAELKLAR
jgi:hypothetical protein